MKMDIKILRQLTWQIRQLDHLKLSHGPFDHGSIILAKDAVIRKGGTKPVFMEGTITE